jgi:hypothetical protein
VSKKKKGHHREGNISDEMSEIMNFPQRIDTARNARRIETLHGSDDQSEAEITQLQDIPISLQKEDTMKVVKEKDGTEVKTTDNQALADQISLLRETIEAMMATNKAQVAKLDEIITASHSQQSMPTIPHIHRPREVKPEIKAVLPPLQTYLVSIPMNDILVELEVMGRGEQEALSNASVLSDMFSWLERNVPGAGMIVLDSCQVMGVEKTIKMAKEVAEGKTTPDVLREELENAGVDIEGRLGLRHEDPLEGFRSMFLQKQSSLPKLGDRLRGKVADSIIWVTTGLR